MEATGPLLRDVLAVIEDSYPPALAQSWDRVGLVVGDLDQPVRRILLAVDPTLAVIDEAVAAGADLLFVHHPLLLRGVHTLALGTAKGLAITRLIRAGAALYTAHTNADVVDVNEALARACGLTDVEPLTMEEGQAMGRVGRLPGAMTLRDFAAALASRLPAAPVGVRVSGDPAAPVATVAVLGGAGDGLFEAVRRSRADVYVTSDLRHHPALEAREEGRVGSAAGTGGGPPYLIDAGHWASEYLWLDEAARRFRTGLQARHGALGAAVTITVSTTRTDPWDFLVTPIETALDDQPSGATSPAKGEPA